MELVVELRGYLIENLGEVKADEYIDGLFEYVENKLDPFPESFSPCINRILREAGCRCLTYRKKYVVVYEVPGPTEVNVLGVIHARRSPKEFEKLVD